MLEVQRFVVSPFMQNTRLLYCTATNKGVLIDPGADPSVIISGVKESGCDLSAIWLTHSHLDHCGAVDRVLEAFPVELLAHRSESEMRQSVSTVAALYGLPPGVFENCREPDRYIDEGDTLSVGEFSFKVLFTPGHSPGHLSFFNSELKLLISGDVLFAGSIGRTDLPGGDFAVLMQTIRDKYFSLPPETKVLSGHGEDTTIGEEMGSNPFLQEMR